MSDNWASPTRIVQFGDGYSERSADGLNRPNEIWEVECAFASETAGANLQTFLETVGGWQAFLWQSPRDTQLQPYIIVQPVGGAVRRGGGAKPYFYTRSLKFKRSGVGVGSKPGVGITAYQNKWVIDRTGITIDPLIVNLSRLVTPSVVPSFFSIAIPANSSAVDILLTASTVSRTETLKIETDPNYNIYTIDTASINVVVETVSVVASGIAGWIISRAAALPTSLIVNYKQISSSPSGTVTGNAVIPANQTSVFVPLNITANTQTETLEIQSDPQYLVNGPISSSISINNYTYISSGDSNGVIADPANNSFLVVTMSSVYTPNGYQPRGPLTRPLGDTTATHASTLNSNNEWWRVEFNGILYPSGFWIRGDRISPYEYLRNYKIQFSNDGVTWVDGAAYVNDQSITLASPFKYGAISLTSGYRYARVLHTGLNSNNSNYLILSGIEFYGIFVRD
jgi:phage-related protein